MSLQTLLDTLSRRLYGKTVEEAHRDRMCITCYEEVDLTRLKVIDAAEYRLSGLCPKCYVAIAGDDAL